MIKKTIVTARTSKRDSLTSGILLIDKPAGMTSNQVLGRVKYALNLKKAGHTGSLDPMATGVLPICLNRATKIAGYLLADDKTYVATMQLGIKTDSGDQDGTICQRSLVPEISTHQIHQVFESFLGPQHQVPPMVSALWHQGKRLYDLARQGLEVERAPRSIRIDSLNLLDFNATTSQIIFEAKVSKGTYIRTLAEDLAEKLGTIATLIALRRTAYGCLSGQKLVSLEELCQQPQAALAQIITMEKSMGHWPRLDISQKQLDDLKQGRKGVTDLWSKGQYRLYVNNHYQALMVLGEPRDRII